MRRIFGKSCSSQQLQCLLPLGILCIFLYKTHAHTHTHTYTHIHSTHTYIYIHDIHTPTHTHTYIHTHIYLHTHTYTHTYLHPYLHIHTHTYTHLHTHTPIYTHLHTKVLCTWGGGEEEEEEEGEGEAGGGGEGGEAIPCSVRRIRASFLIVSSRSLCLWYVPQIETPDPVCNNYNNEKQRWYMLGTKEGGGGIFSVELLC